MFSDDCSGNNFIHMNKRFFYCYDFESYISRITIAFGGTERSDKFTPTQIFSTIFCFKFPFLKLNINMFTNHLMVIIKDHKLKRKLYV